MQPTQQVARRIKLRSRGGCMECKLRKCKCDETRPTCGPCGRSGRSCRWLDSSTTYERQLFEQRKGQGAKVQLVLKKADGPAPLPVSSLQRSFVGEHGDLRISFLLHTVFTGANKDCAGAGASALTVRTELQFAGDKGSLTWNTLNAMSMVYWGSKHKDQHVLAAGYKARSTSLARLRDAVARDASSLSGDVVAAVSLARLFETMLPNTRSQWTLHAQGMSRLFVAMGPSAFRSPSMRRLVENNRWVIIMACSLLRQPTTLNTVAWKTVPWQNTSKDMLQSLLDTYARVPALHATWDLFVSLPVDQQSNAIATDIVSQLRTTLWEMHCWRELAELELTKSVVPYADASGQDVECPWQPAIAFAELHHAYAIALYNMMIIILSRYINRFPEAGDTVSGPASHDLPSDLLHKRLLPIRAPYQKASIAANELASIAAWTLQERQKGAGALYLAGPMHVCDSFWQLIDPDKAVWSGKVIKIINATWDNLVLSDIQLMQHELA